MDNDKLSSEDLPPGTMIADKYRIEREIGRGGMGVVVAATHVELEQSVAIKILQRSSAYSQDALARFSREARATAKIRSEHVARIMDVGKMPDGLTYIVMEYLDGNDLAVILRKEGPLRISLAADYILQACEGIAAAHAVGIIHRDIKPANLFLARQPGQTTILKVLDFGVSKITKVGMNGDEGSATQTGQVFGSPMYMSPEQLDTTVPVDGRTDIWALGVVLFELLTGKPPFGGKSSANIMTAVLRDSPPKLRTLRPDAPADLEEVVARCLEKERELRYATIIDLAEAIAPFCGKGADDAVDRIYRILAHASADAAETTASGASGEKTTASKEGSSSGRSLERPSDPIPHSDNSLHGGASRTHDGIGAPSKRQAAVVTVVVAALAAVGLVFLGKRAEPTPRFVAASSSVVPVIEPQLPASTPASTPAATPASAPTSVAASNSAEAAPKVAEEVTITFSGAPRDTKVFRGDAELGRTTTPLRLPRSAEKITLRFVADTFAPAEVELIPNVDQTLAITLKPAKAGTTKRHVPKELEPF